MKKQLNPTIKAHLIRGAFYLLLLLAVCAIPFALAQSKRNQRDRKQSRRQAKCAREHVQPAGLATVLMELFPTSRCRTFPNR